MATVQSITGRRGIVRQCAWCRRRIGRNQDPVGPPIRLLAQASHGICRPCLNQMKVQYALGSQSA